MLSATGFSVDKIYSTLKETLKQKNIKRKKSNKNDINTLTKRQALSKLKVKYKNKQGGAKEVLTHYALGVVAENFNGLDIRGGDDFFNFEITATANNMKADEIGTIGEVSVNTKEFTDTFLQNL